MKIPRIYFIAILLVTVMCSPVLAEKSRGQSDTEKEIKKSVIAIGQTGKEVGKIIGQHIIKIGKQTGKVFTEMARDLRDSAQK